MEDVLELYIIQFIYHIDICTYILFFNLIHIKIWMISERDIG